MAALAASNFGAQGVPLRDARKHFFPELWQRLEQAWALALERQRLNGGPIITVADNHYLHSHYGPRHSRADHISATIEGVNLALGNALIGGILCAVGRRGSTAGEWTVLTSEDIEVARIDHSGWVTGRITCGGVEYWGVRIIAGREGPLPPGVLPNLSEAPASAPIDTKPAAPMVTNSETTISPITANALASPAAFTGNEISGGIPPKSPRARGGHRAADAPLVEEMHRLREADKDLSVHAAAVKVADCATGSVVEESRVRRLEARYKEHYPDWRR